MCWQKSGRWTGFSFLWLVSVKTKSLFTFKVRLEDYFLVLLLITQVFKGHTILWIVLFFRVNFQEIELRLRKETFVWPITFLQLYIYIYILWKKFVLFYVWWSVSPLQLCILALRVSPSGLEISYQSAGTTVVHQR